MKKLLFFSLIAAMSVGAYLAVNGVNDSKDDLLSQNIEALSAGETTTYPDALIENCIYRRSSQCNFVFEGVLYFNSNMFKIL